jgi:hypothetical protein
MEALRNITFFVAFITIPIFIAIKCEQGKDPYEPGSHLNYTIECENGFVYKCMGRDKGTIQVLNSDGTPLKCGEKIY